MRNEKERKREDKRFKREREDLRVERVTHLETGKRETNDEIEGEDEERRREREKIRG